MDVTPSRRELTKRRNHAAIVSAAAALFDERGYEATTTADVAVAAEVAAGTVFRYAATKSELLLLVYNDRFESAVLRGVERARSCHDVSDALVALCTAVLEAGAEHPEDVARYQRELMFGVASGPRAAGLRIVKAWESAAAEVLRAAGVAAAPAEWAARTAYAVLHIAVLAPEGVPDPRTTLDRQIQQIVRGAGAAASPSDPAGDPRGGEGEKP